MNDRQLLVNAFLGIAQQEMLHLMGASKFERQSYHAAAHPPDVYRGAVRVGKCILGNAYQGIDDLVLMACAAHDVIQEATATTKEGFAYRVRRRGDNERATAKWAGDTLRTLRAKHFRPGIIDDEEIQQVETAILWTIPEWSVEYGTMVQPHLWGGLQTGNIRGNAVAISVAMGDLLPVGHQPQTFLASSDPLFVEEWVGIDEMLHEARRQADIPLVRANKALELMAAWDASQVKFAHGRKKAFERETSFFPDDIRDELRARINRFDDSAKRAALRADLRSKLDVFAYASEMGFKDVPME